MWSIQTTREVQLNLKLILMTLASKGGRFDLPPLTFGHHYAPANDDKITHTKTYTLHKAFGSIYDLILPVRYDDIGINTGAMP